MPVSIEKIGIVGSGLLGTDIGQFMFLMLGGLDWKNSTRLVFIDRDEKQLSLARQRLSKEMSKKAGGSLPARLYVDHMINRRITFSTSYHALKDCDLVIEAVVEREDVKRQVYASIEQVVSDECLIASNTSHMTRAALCHEMLHPERFLILHHFFPASKNMGVEVVGEDPLAENIRQWLNSIGRIAVRVDDRWGFAFNTFLEGLCYHLICLVEDGVASPKELDAVAEEVFNMKLAPFKLLKKINAVGIIRTGIDGFTRESRGSWMHVPESLQKHFAENTHFPIADIDPYWITTETVTVARERKQRIADELRAAYLSIYAWVREMDLIDPDDLGMGIEAFLDLPHPRDFLAAVGTKEAIRLGLLFEKRHKQFVLPAWFEKPAKLEEMFYAARVKRFDRHGVAVLEVREPNKGNLLSPEAFDDLVSHLTDIESDHSLGFVVTGAGVSCIAGAHLEKLITDWSQIDAQGRAAVQRGKETLALVDRVLDSKPGVGAINGFCLGGGMELMIRLNRRLMIEQKGLAEMGLVETRLGLFPGWDGTVFAPRLVKRKYLDKMIRYIRQGRRFGAREALEMGLIDKIVARQDLLAEAISDVREIASGKLEAPRVSRAALLDPPSELAAVSLRYNSRNTDKLLVEVLLRGLRTDATEASQIEGDAFVEVLHSQDVRTGVHYLLNPQRDPKGKPVKPRFIHR